MKPATIRRFGLASLLILALGGCSKTSAPGPRALAPSATSQGSPIPVGTATPPEAAPAPALIAKLVTPATAFSEPAGSTVVTQLETSVRSGGGPTELLVLDHRFVGEQEWLRVLLPIRPNDASGWIDASRARLLTSTWRIVISTERRTVEVFNGQTRVRSFRAVVGAPGTPTPHGSFAIEERISLADPNNFYGSWILTLTAHSNVLDTFAGGDGRVAIHGRGGSSLQDPLGTARSHGCIRLDNAAIDWLATIAQPGTAVVIG
jgi:lipoprotein-anchoring transpeptidase ErfK/SrfK